jgi:Tol biopolymer transport system component
VSPDGRYLLYTWADYGTFPIWHAEADLQMIDLATGQTIDVSRLNDTENADSYHSWSSNGRWVMYGSRRLDGRYTRLFIAHMDEQGRPSKPFLLPQEDPRQNSWRLMSFNVPEFLSGKVELPKEAADMFYSEE